MVDFRTSNDFILRFLAEFDKESCVASHTDEQVAVIVRVFLGIDQGFAIDAVDLGMVNTKYAHGLYHVHSMSHTVFTLDEIRFELHIELRALGKTRMRQVAD